MKPYIVNIAITLICTLGTFLLAVLARNSEGFAQWYSETIYKGLVNTVGRFWGMLPFSAVEILLYILIAAIVLTVLYILIRLIRGGWDEKTKTALTRFVSALLCIASLLFFIYMASCGVNYYRTSFSDSTGIHVESYSTEELSRVCLLLTEELNSLADEVSRDDAGIMVCQDGLEMHAAELMGTLAETYPELKGYYPLPKMLLVPEILSVQKITGIYSPFTIEANCNGDITAYNVPFTACHELSHLRGFMQEEEANFIAWLACRKSGRADFQYSGSLRGWISCMNVLYRSDPETWAQIRVQLSPLVEADLAANRAYWAKYEGPIADAAQTVNDNYLKANGQTDGVQSYGRMADLIAAYFIKCL